MPHPDHWKTEYDWCMAALDGAGLLTLLPKSGCKGIVGFDGNDYPVPTAGQVADLFERNGDFVREKVLQGFDRLEMVPLAMSAGVLIDRLAAAIVRHAADGRIFRTRRSPSDPLVPVRVNTEKHVWVWDVLRGALDTGELVYFPREYSRDHEGLTKGEAIRDGRICAIPGWSVGLIESTPVMMQQGRAQTLGGRKQLEIGCSPREYLKTLSGPEYHGETGKTVEDFIVRFLINLETTHEVSNDVDDENAMWCLGQYMKIPYAEVVPTGRWHRSVGRVRLDMHRTGNKLCAKSWGGSTTVRLPRL